MLLAYYTLNCLTCLALNTKQTITSEDILQYLSYSIHNILSCPRLKVFIFSFKKKTIIVTECSSTLVLSHTPCLITGCKLVHSQANLISLNRLIMNLLELSDALKLSSVLHTHLNAGFVLLFLQMPNLLFDLFKPKNITLCSGVCPFV